MQPQLSFAFNHPSKKAAICGEVDEDGVVEFAIQVTADAPVRGTELFRRMMLAFGDEAKAIRGVWRKSSAPSINIDRVNELTATGMTLEEAIAQTWTVTRARKLGFTKVQLLRSEEGIPGTFTKIDVLIEK